MMLEPKALFASKGEVPVVLARTHEAVFTDTLVRKFGLPVEGWRGAAERREH